MGLVNSNIFNMNIDTLELTNSSDEIITPLNKKINIKETYGDVSYSLLSESRNKRLNLKIKEHEFNFIDVNKDNFSKYQYDLLNNKYIALYLDDSAYKFQTPTGVIYTLHDESLITIIMNTPRPRKIVYDYPCNTNSTYSMQLLANMLENIKTNTLEDLIKSYGLEYNNINDSLNILINIYKVYENLIFKYDFNHYVNFEHSIYRIFKNINFNLNENLIESRLNECIETLSRLNDRLDTSDIIKDTSTPSTELLLELSLNTKDNNSIYTSFNSNILKNLNLSDYSNLVDILYEVEFLNNLPNIHYDTYNYSYIKSYTPKLENISENTIIFGGYQNLFQNLFAEVSKNNDYINIVNNNKNIILEKLSKSRTVTDNLLLLIQYCIEGYMNNCTTTEEFKLYLYKHKLTLLSDDDINLLVDILNTDLREIIDCIDSYDNSIITCKLLLHEEVKNFTKMYLNMKRKLLKNLILEVSDYINDFNNQNKAKIYLLGYANDGIYLECQNDSFEIAVDTLTRTLVKVYDKYLKKTKSLCYIENLSAEK